MNFVFFDTETTTLEPTFGQMVEFSAVFCDESLNQILDSINLSCRLSPWVIPDPKALLVTNKTVEEINSSKMTHYDMVSKIIEKSQEWSPSLWIGWNTMGFDFSWLSLSLYKCLHNPYFHQLQGNRRADALTIARVIHHLDRGKLEIPTGENQRETFKLSSVSRENLVDHKGAHSASSDTLATLGLCRIMSQRSEELWQGCLATSCKSDVERLVNRAPIFTYVESNYGGTKSKLMTMACYHPEYKYPVGLDLRLDPKDYINMGIEELGTLLRRSPKMLRVIRPNKHPIILDPEYSLRLGDYRHLDAEEYIERAKYIKGSKELREKLTRILSEESLSKKGKQLSNRKKEVEEQMVRLPFEDTEEDILVKLEYHQSPSWLEKSKLGEKFMDDRYKYLARRLVYENSPEDMAPEHKKELELEMSLRVRSREMVPWNTVLSTKKMIEELKTLTKTQREKEILNSLENYLEKI